MTIAADLEDLPPALRPALKRPSPYAPGDDTIWDNSHISKALLEAHLDPETDRASYKLDTIESIITWLAKRAKLPTGAAILDLGCGPGLYTLRWAQQGYDARGIDLSARSIEHATRQASLAELNVDYVQGNYLEVEFGGLFDLITMISCDFGVLTPEQQSLLLSKARGSLKQHGHFAFDFLSEKHLEHLDLNPRYEVSNGGFWSPGPHHVLSQTWIYADERMRLDQHAVMQDGGGVTHYRFWEHVFSEERLSRMLTAAGFGELSFAQDLTGTPLSADSTTLAVVARP